MEKSWNKPTPSNSKLYSPTTRKATKGTHASHESGRKSKKSKKKSKKRSKNKYVTSFTSSSAESVWQAQMHTLERDKAKSERDKELWKKKYETLNRRMKEKVS